MCDFFFFVKRWLQSSFRYNFLISSDLPSVVSGDRVVIIDPCEKYFVCNEDKTTGYSWHLTQHRRAISRIPDQFSPYRNVFGCKDDTFDKGCYKGTLFRFPLRSEPSELSSTIYTPTRVQELFSNFEHDAQLILLFLKNLESIELLTRDCDSLECRLCFKVCISPSCLEYVRHQKQIVQQKMSPGKWLQRPVTVTYPLVINTYSYGEAGDETKRVYKWMVNEYYDGGEASVQLQTLQKDQTLCYMPLAGTAMALGTRERDAAVVREPTDSQTNATEKKDAVMADAPNGQVFCFLPLPMEQKSSTGLPVHVNGYFAISQNRRHLKWPTAGQNVRTDKTLLWNQCLLQEVLPKSYIELILQVRRLCCCFLCLYAGRGGGVRG